MCAAPALADESPALDIDPDRVTVSGISSGAQMATQLHIAYSDLFSGAALLSGGPYNCAANSLMIAMKRCMTSEEAPAAAVDYADGIRAAAEKGLVADPANLADDRVWLFRGTKDSKISGPVHWAAADLYAEFIPEEQILRVDDIEADRARAGRELDLRAAPALDEAGTGRDPAPAGQRGAAGRVPGREPAGFPRSPRPRPCRHRRRWC